MVGTPLTGVSGALTAAAHSGRTLLISGNVTIPIVNGFQAFIVSAGSFTVGAGGATTALVVDEAIGVWVNNSVVRRTPIQTTVVMPQS